MKKLTATLFLVSIVAWFNAISAPIQIAGSLVTVSNTTAYFGSNVINSPQISFSVLNLSNNGLANTNAATVTIQISPDQTNWTTALPVYYFSQTNAGTYSYYTPSTNLNIYLRLVVTTTNAVQFGATYGN